MRRIPETYRNQDWPRKVSQSVSSLVSAIRALQSAMTAAEVDIDALQAATDWTALSDYADDTAAAAGGVAVGSLYRTGSTLKVRVS